MGTLKVWDGTAWQTVSQQGPAGPIGPAHATTHQTGGTDPIVGRLALAVGTGEVVVGSLASPVNTGGYTTAIGQGALALQQAAANSNTAVGYNAGTNLTTGVSNTLVGRGAGNSITTGNYNVLIGQTASVNAATDSQATAVGISSKAAANATAIGNGAVAAGVGSVAIGCDSTGAAATATATDQFFLGTARHNPLIPGRLYMEHGGWRNFSPQWGSGAFTTDAGGFFYPNYSGYSGGPFFWLSNSDGANATILAVNTTTATYAQCRAWAYGGLLVNTTVYVHWLAIGTKP